MMPWRRILFEKRRAIVPLAVLAGVNLVLYATAIYPLNLQVENASQRARASAMRADQARETLGAARAALDSKARAAKELERFYREVLPVDLAGARRATYGRVAQLADELNLRYERRVSAPEDVRDSALVRLVTTMVLVGNYADIRRLIYRLETAPEFLVIDDVTLEQGEELGLTLSISTYYRAAG